MRFCYVDEAGDGAALVPGAVNVSPVFCIVGLVIDGDALTAATRDFLDLKKRYFPGLFARRPFLDGMIREVKGSQLRKDLRSGSRNERRAAVLFLGEVVSLAERYGGVIVGRVWVKATDKPIDERSTYAFSIQDLSRHFQDHLRSVDDKGLVICDSRTKSLNARVSHSIFTQKFRRDGDPFDRMVEMPVFSHSDNHAGLQLADLLVSGLVFPMACRAYCAGHLSTHHVDARYEVLRGRFGARLRNLQYRYRDDTGKHRGGLVVSDSLRKQPGKLLFDQP